MHYVIFLFSLKINIWGEDSSLQDKQGHIFTTWAFKLPKFGVSEDLSDNFQKQVFNLFWRNEGNNFEKVSQK